MKKNKISVLPVMNKKGIVGMISEEDLIGKAFESSDFLFE